MSGYEDSWAGTSWKVNGCQVSCGLQINDCLTFHANGAAITLQRYDPISQTMIALGSWGQSCTYTSEHLAQVILGTTQYDIERNQGELTCNLSTSPDNSQPTGGAPAAKVPGGYACHGNHRGARLFGGLKGVVKSLAGGHYPESNDTPNADDPPTVWTAQSGSTGGSGGSGGAPAAPKKPKYVSA